MAAQAQAAIQIGKFQLKGKPALYTVRLILIALLIWLLYRFPPTTNWPMWLSAAGWVGFSVYWGIAGKNSAAVQTSESAESRRVHVLLTNIGQLLLFVPVPGLRQVIVPESPVWIAVGLAMQWGAIALAVWARRRLGSNWSGRIEIKKDHELVRTGPYRLLRHPIYTAVLGLCLGTALVNRQVHAVVGVAMVVGAYWRKIRLEEAKLREAFGPEYDRYRRQTWGMIPGWF